jgi:hypothetical protein
VRQELTADVLENARSLGVEVRNGKGTTFGLELKGVANIAVIAGLTPFTKGGWGTVRDEGLQLPFLLKRIGRAEHGHRGLVFEAQGRGRVWQDGSATCKGSAKAMHGKTELFEQGQAVLCQAGGSHGLTSFGIKWMEMVIPPSQMESHRSNPPAHGGLEPCLKWRHANNAVWIFFKSNDVYLRRKCVHPLAGGL